MAEIPRLNGVIRTLEQGKSAFVTFAPAESGQPRRLMLRLMTAWYSRWSIGPTISVLYEIACNSCWIGGKYCGPGARHRR